MAAADTCLPVYLLVYACWEVLVLSAVNWGVGFEAHVGASWVLKETLWPAIVVGLLLVCACDYMLPQNLHRHRSLRSRACRDV